MEQIKGGIYFRNNGRFYFTDSIPESFPEDERRILMLYVVEGKTIKETAKTLGFTPERVKQIKSKAIRRLKINRKLTCV
jgi:RNA polymerase sigma factor (sigma-70 family)